MDNVSDKRISLALIATPVVLISQYFILSFFGLMGTAAGNMLQIASKGIVGLLFVLAFSKILDTHLLFLIKVYFIALTIYTGNYIFFPENRQYLVSIIFPLFFTGIPAFILSVAIKNLECFYKFIKKGSIVIFFVGTILGFLVLIGTIRIGTYSMPLSYYMLIPAIVFLGELIKRPNAFNIVVSALSILNILFLGARGPLLSIAVFVFLYFIKTLKGSSYSRVKIYSIGVYLFVFVSFFYIQILLRVIDLLSSFGINTRTLTLLARGNIYLSGRDTISNKIVDEIYNNPIFGLGLAADRRVLQGSSIYAHNIFLEVILGFGVVLGVAIIAIFLLYLIKAIIASNDFSYTVLILWISLGFIPLLVSSSYLININFWILLGTIVNINSLKIRKQQESSTFPIVFNESHNNT